MTCYHALSVVHVCLERKPTADQELTDELDEVLADVDQLQRQLTGVQQQSLPTDVSQATDMISRYEVLMSSALL